MADITNVIGTQMENVRPKLQPLIEMTTGVGAFIKRNSEAHKVSMWSQTLDGGQTLAAFRMPLQRWEGGDYATFDYDNGDLGSGSMMNAVFLSMGTFHTRVAVTMSALAIKSTASSEQAIINAWKYQLKTAIKTYQVYYDTDIHQDGTGVLATGNGTGTSSSTNPTYNLEANFGAQRLRKNQLVEVFSADLTTSKGQLRVASFDQQAKTVTLTGTVTGAGFVNTDKIAYPGMTATLAVGSWRNGLYTFNNSATSGYTLGLNRATVTELVCPTVAAGSNPLTPAMGLLLNDIQIQLRDPEALAGQRGISHMAQRAAWYLQGLAISEWKRGSRDSMIDLIPKEIGQDTTFTYCGVDYMVSKKQDRSRLDVIVPKTWCRALFHEADFFTSPDGSQRFFVNRSSSTANPKAGFTFYIVGSDNLANTDSQCSGTISGLSLPAGY